jgi:hypothetical protein
MSFRDVMLDPEKRAALIAENRQRNAEARSEMGERQGRPYSGESSDPCLTYPSASSAHGRPPAAARQRHYDDQEIEAVVARYVDQRLVPAVAKAITGQRREIEAAMAEERAVSRRQIAKLRHQLRALQKQLRERDQQLRLVA